MPNSNEHLPYAAAYENVTQALAALDAIQQLREDGVIGASGEYRRVFSSARPA